MIERYGRALSVSRAFYPVCYLGLALIYLWPLVLHPDSIPARPGDPLSDLHNTHLPNAEYIRRSLAQEGRLPLWNSMIFAGQPFAADPQAGLWYPLYLLLFILPLPLAFNVLFALHLAWAGYGLCRFLWAEGLSQAPSFFGGLAFAGTPWVIAHLGAGHMGYIFAAAWIPWMLLAVRPATSGGGLRRGAIVGSVLALIIHVQLQLGFYAIALAAVFWLTRWARLRLSGQVSAPVSAMAYAALACVGLCLSLSAIVIVPFVEFIRYTGRNALVFEDAALLSLPPYPYLLGLFIPIRGVLHEWVTYTGIVTLILALLGIRRRPFFWISAVLFAAAFALGSNFLLFPVLFRLVPGLSFLRVPARTWLFVALGLSVLAAHGMEVLLAEVLPRLRNPARFPLLARMLPPAQAAFLALVIVTLVDLLIINASELEARPANRPVLAAEWIEAQPGLFRVYSPSRSLPLPDALQHLEGVSPVHLIALSDFAAHATGIPVQGYSISVPFTWVDEPDPDPARIRLASSPDARLLGWLNVKYVAAEFPLNSLGLKLVRTFGRTRVYENLLVRPRAWMAGDGSVEIRAWSPDRMEIVAEGPGRLVVSEVVYPGWEARVDGKPARIETIAGLFRGISLEAGTHSLVLEFRPQTVYAGLMITGLGLVTLIGIVLWIK